MMTQKNPILEAMALLPQEEQEQFLAEALSAGSVVELERVLLRLPLRDISSNTKAQVAFHMGMTPVGHSENRGGSTREWNLPTLAGPLRLSVYDLSRLASAIQMATTNLASGRGDYGTLYLLLAPAKLEELAGSIRSLIQGYTSQLRDAGRRPRSNTMQRSRTNAPVNEIRQRDKPTRRHEPALVLHETEIEDAALPSLPKQPLDYASDSDTEEPTSSDDDVEGGDAA